MYKIKEILRSIESYAPLDLQENYDNSGIQIGNIDQAATAALLCLDVTEEVIDEAIERGCNLIIAHHPIAFKPFRSLTGATYVERCMLKACKNDIVIYASHTNMDNATGGVSFKMAEMLGLQSIEILQPHPNGNSGSGVIGQLICEEAKEEFLQRVKRVFKCERISHSAGSAEMIKNIAICGGSGAFFIPEAIKAGADAFITGEAKYNDYFDVEDKLLLTVIGHYESEACTKEVFYDIISKDFPTFAVHFSNANSNPVKYL